MEEIRRADVNLTFENLEGQDEICLEASAVQREEVELARPFLIWQGAFQGVEPCPVG